jgi:hypothetical protein
MVIRDDSNPLSRPYEERLQEMGFTYKVELPLSIEPNTLKDVNYWLIDQGYKIKVDFIMSNWTYYFKDHKLAMLFRLRWGR